MRSASSLMDTVMPVMKETLAVSADVLKFAPCPGLEEAARTLLGIWEACEHIETNKYACLRLIERCATMLFSVRCEIAEAGEAVRQELEGPVAKLFDTIYLIESFLQSQLHRSFAMRYLRRNEIRKEMDACDKALEDVVSMFGVSVQLRILKQVLENQKEGQR
ncbi:hypothetical protein F5I97DRAFT_1816649, partial [Phlebopus sp. FC_14]